MMTEAKSDDLVSKLQSLDPGYLPENVFHAIARLVVLPTYVVIPLLVEKDALRVYLARRPHNDPHYAGLLHPPGTVIRPTDRTLADCYHRLLRSELNEVSVKRGPVFVDLVFEQIKRGREISLLHCVELENARNMDSLCDVDNLPADVMPTDVSRIAMVVNRFRNQQ
jgi:hypothetical protein